MRINWTNHKSSVERWVHSFTTHSEIPTKYQLLWHPERTHDQQDRNAPLGDLRISQPFQELSSQGEGRPVADLERGRRL